MVQITKSEAKQFISALEHQCKALLSQQRDEYEKNGLTEYYKHLIKMRKDKDGLIEYLYNSIKDI